MNFRFFSFLSFSFLGFFSVSCRSSFTENDAEIKQIEYRPTSNYEYRQKNIQVPSKLEVKPQNKNNLAPKLDFEIGDSRKVLQLWEQGEMDLKIGAQTAALKKAHQVLADLERQENLSIRIYLKEEEKNAYFFVARTFLQFTDFSANGVSIFVKLIEIDPTNEKFYENLAHHYIRTDALSLAENVLLKALNHVETLSEKSYFELAHLQKKNGKIQKAQQTIGMAKSLYPKSALSIFWDGLVAYDNGFISQACHAFESAFPQLQELEAAHYNLIFCVLKQNDLERAKALLTSALKVFPHQSSFLLLSGVLAQKSGDKVAARKAWKSYLLNTDDEKMRIKIQTELTQLL